MDFDHFDGKGCECCTVDTYMICNAWTKTALFALSFATIQSHIGQKVLLQHSFIFGHMDMKHPVCSIYISISCIFHIGGLGSKVMLIS